MNELNKTSQQIVNALFSFLNNLENVVFWACTPDYSHQLYINDSYEKIWGRPKEELFKDLTVWRTTIVQDDLLSNMNEFKRRMISPGIGSMGFRIARPDNELRYIKNTSFTLYDKDNNPSIILGVDENLGPEHWESWLQNGNDMTKAPFLKEFANIFQNECGLHLPNETPTIVTQPPTKNVIYIKNEAITLTNRESQCLKLILQGKSAKQIAYQLNISTRTAEIHMDNIRRKAKCRTKFELISKLQYF